MSRTPTLICVNLASGRPSQPYPPSCPIEHAGGNIRPCSQNAFDINSGRPDAMIIRQTARVIGDGSNCRMLGRPLIQVNPQFGKQGLPWVEERDGMAEKTRPGSLNCDTRCRYCPIQDCPCDRSSAELPLIGPMPLNEKNPHLETRRGLASCLRHDRSHSERSLWRR